MTNRVGAKGQVVIPKEIRDALHIQPGAEVDITARGEIVQVKVRTRPTGLGGRFQGSGMSRRLLEDRGREPR